MSSEFGHVQTVLGKVHADELGITLPHEHLFNDLSPVLAEPTYEFSTKIVRQEVTPSWQWALKQDPYCCADNVAAKPVDDIVREAEIFQALGGKTIVDATGSAKIGRNPARLKEAAERTGLHVIMATGTYLEKFERADIAGPSVEEIRDRFLEELTNGVEGVFPGLIGEIGVSPAFTEGERAALKGAALAQAGFGGVALNIHMPGWQRRGDEVLDIVLDECRVDPRKVSLAHSDPSGEDLDYQMRLLKRGVWLEFDMIGLDITFPGEGISPTISQTARTVANLINEGFGDQILLSHDLFLKQMWASKGGNGFTVVPTVFRELLITHGIDESVVDGLITTNPQRYLGDAVR
ncbi:hypothetical protein QP880_07805 [Dermabacter hominis]|uniref:phosphotriesterase family protein n=1 Tax=Dermabacter hominis TaxID=36740 RepID=UPI00316ADB58|nr:hypothetical protein [Dermabacter hominis]